MSDELKPCPFCGATTHIVKHGPQFMCIVCGAEGPDGRSGPGGSAAGWNRRFEADALRERNAELAAERNTALFRAEMAEALEAGLRDQHQRLCVDWVAALGNPANPEELDKAIAESPTLRADLAILRAKWAGVPREAIDAIIRYGLDAYVFTPKGAHLARHEVIDWLDTYRPQEAQSE